MGIFLVGEAEHRDTCRRVLRQNGLAQDAPTPLAPVPRIGDPGFDDAYISVPFGGEVEYSAKIALEIAAGDAEAGAQIAVRADAPVEAQRGHDLGPIRPDRLA